MPSSPAFAIAAAPFRTFSSATTALSHRPKPFSTVFLPPLARRPPHFSPTPKPFAPRSPRAQLAPAPDALRDVPEPVLRAVEKLRRQPRVTISDVAAAAGLAVPAARDGLVTLASVTGAAIDVTDSGEIAYRFPRDVRQVLRQRSVLSAARQAWDRVFPTLFSGVRIAFGGFLVLSIVVSFLAIAALSASGRSDDNDNRRGGGGGMMFGPRLFGPNIFDVMFYSRRARYRQPVYGRGGREVVQEKPQMSFLESVYSFVFGDGDPNADVLDRRWRKVAAVIRANGGSIAAEQVAPFLDLPESYAPDRRSVNVDEGYMLDVLQRFHGHPEVTDDGDLIYVFPDFGTTGSVRTVDVVGAASTAALREEEFKISSASSSQQLIAGGLGALNVFGVTTLGSMLRTAIPRTADSAALLSAARGIYPALAAYALTFVLIPTLRYFWQKGKNARIRARNASRARASVALARPSIELSSKLAAAEGRKVGSKVVGSDRVVYSSDEGADQPGIRREETQDFDRRLGDRDGKGM